jgi:hypothetical protein
MDMSLQIIGAAMAVHNKISPGHKEAVWQAMVAEGNPQIEQTAGAERCRGMTQIRNRVL